MTLSTIRASPCALSVTDLVVNAAIVVVSAPQYSAASTVFTGPTVLSSGPPVPVISRSFPHFTELV
jgi:hypothetical protein